ncbi:hypothetical protein [uncultured Comamonas sp.]|uniref:hypothetical protein n=1 Tax=uncultured Comamonas sp. TaxID=114710 RepID=UPI0025E15FB8|nr:hypothetical protein [uncultured Comamonas sp.]
MDFHSHYSGYPVSAGNGLQSSLALLAEDLPLSRRPWLLTGFLFAYSSSRVAGKWTMRHAGHLIGDGIWVQKKQNRLQIMSSEASPAFSVIQLEAEDMDEFSGCGPASGLTHRPVPCQ